MATTKIWKITSNINQVIKYIKNPEKTKYDILNDVIEYARNFDKTERELFVSGINCSPNSVYYEMIMTKKRFNKNDGILAYHGYQSFKENEVNSKLAHEIGIKLANEMWGDKYEVLVTTHLNTKHIHNHFVVNSVSFIDGKKFNSCRASTAEFRKINDLICEEYGLSVLEENITKSGINFSNYQKKNDNSSYSKQTKQDVDLAIALSNSLDEFMNVLRNMNYEVIIRANKLSVRSLDYKRNIRIERQFGEDYTIENINKQILGLYLPEQKKIYSNYFKRDNTMDFLFKVNLKGIAKSYIRYLKILNKYPTYIKKHKVSSEIQKDVLRMEEINKQTILLVENKIETKEDFDNYYISLIDELNKTDNKEDIKNKIKICEEIRNRKEIVEEITKEKESRVIIK